MNKLIFTLVTFLCLNNILAQYQPIYRDSSTYFRVTEEVFDAAIGGVLLEFTTDTLVNNQLYKKTYFSRFIPELKGFFREDTLAEKAWFYGLNDTAEILIMDLNLEVGDTFHTDGPNFYHYSSEKFVIVDSVTQWNGIKVITFNDRYGGGFIGDR